jgi:hypothetical protein
MAKHRSLGEQVAQQRRGRGADEAPAKEVQFVRLAVATTSASPELVVEVGATRIAVARGLTQSTSATSSRR